MRRTGEDIAVPKLPLRSVGRQAVDTPSPSCTSVVRGQSVRWEFTTIRGLFISETRKLRPKEVSRLMKSSLRSTSNVHEIEPELQRHMYINCDAQYGLTLVQDTPKNGLIILNLNRNHISGQIPESISNLQQLSSLDFSSNNLFGPIPPSMLALDSLGFLNLSNNNFFGAIPYTGHMTTFQASSYAGNPEHCGGPLAKNCSAEGVWTSDRQWQWLLAMQRRTALEIFKHALQEDRDPLCWLSWDGPYGIEEIKSGSTKQLVH
ncbi:hypothetical protein SO802_008419 [Lithocarpus litseifolius]|uniref:Uncharacterized protein n=1 Tax=Lithocarpus litseifolius TaxID=425828 RepID=A0AAW2DAQ4_9ROSI